MDPLASTGGLDLSAPHVIAVVAIALVFVVAGASLRRFLMAYADELAELWRQFGPIALRRLLARRKVPVTPWFCARCKSYNARATTRCYSCDAKRAEAEAPVPDADIPASPSAGGSRRARR